MVDTLLRNRKKAQASTILRRLGLWEGGESRDEVRYALVTLHRPGNVDDRVMFEEVLSAFRLTAISTELPVVFPVHPRTVARIKEFGLESKCRIFGAADRINESNRGHKCFGGYAQGAIIADALKELR